MTTPHTGTIASYYRSLSSDIKAFLAVANREVGLGPTLEFLAEQAGFPSELRDTERNALRELAVARNVRIQI